MIHTRDNRILCLVLMQQYGFTYSELDKMNEAERNNWIDAHEELQNILNQMSDQESEEDDV